MHKIFLRIQNFHTSLKLRIRILTPFLHLSLQANKHVAHCLAKQHIAYWIANQHIANELQMSPFASIVEVAETNMEYSLQQLQFPIGYNANVPAFFFYQSKGVTVPLSNQLYPNYIYKPESGSNFIWPDSSTNSYGNCFIHCETNCYDPV